MTTMLKMVLPVALCLAYLWLQVDGAPYGQGGDEVKAGAGTDQCPQLQYECTRSDCAERCANLNNRRGRCIPKNIQCGTVDVRIKWCTCLGQSSNSDESSEYAGAGEGSSTNVSNSDNSYTSVAKPSHSKPGASSKAPALNTPTAAPGAASAESAKPTTAPPAYKDLNSSAANGPATTVKAP